MKYWIDDLQKLTHIKYVLVHKKDKLLGVAVYTLSETLICVFHKTNDMSHEFFHFMVKTALIQLNLVFLLVPPELKKECRLLSLAADRLELDKKSLALFKV